MEPEFIKKVNGTLFPQSPVEEQEEICAEEIPLFSTAELKAAILALPGRKALGPYGIPNEFL